MTLFRFVYLFILLGFGLLFPFLLLPFFFPFIKSFFFSFFFFLTVTLKVRLLVAPPVCVYDGQLTTLQERFSQCYLNIASSRRSLWLAFLTTSGDEANPGRVF